MTSGERGGLPLAIAALAAGCGGPGGAAVDAPAPGYDELVLADHPVAFWDVGHPGEVEPDLTGHGHDGAYLGGTPGLAALPDGELAAVFDGVGQYLSIPSSAAFSIPTTGALTWEAWIRPTVLQFPNDTGGYVDWMGKCEAYAPSCEWEARLYDTTNPEGRCNRFSAYAFNPTAGLGSAADWQPTCGLIEAGTWHHVVGEYTTLRQPAGCPDEPAYPGSLAIWVDGIAWDQAAHNPTGCMSQYAVVPAAGDSPLDVGTMALDSWFAGAIGKVAIYDTLLDAGQIARHYEAMTGAAPSGSCGDTCTIP